MLAAATSDVAQGRAGSPAIGNHKAVCAEALHRCCQRRRGLVCTPQCLIVLDDAESSLPRLFAPQHPYRSYPGSTSPSEEELREARQIRDTCQCVLKMQVIGKTVFGFCEALHIIYFSSRELLNRIECMTGVHHRRSTAHLYGGAKHASTWKCRQSIRWSNSSSMISRAQFTLGNRKYMRRIWPLLPGICETLAAARSAIARHASASIVRQRPSI